MLSDASSYHVHHEMQVAGTLSFIESTIKKMDWTHEHNDIIVDVGCGDGDSCRELLLPAFPKVKKIIGIDILPDMVDFAKKNNSHDKIEYHVADIANKDTLTSWKGNVSKIISLYCLHWIKNQREAFENMHQLLKFGGEAALIFVISSPLWNSFEKQVNDPKLKECLQKMDKDLPESHSLNYNAAYYKTLLENVGFEVITCKVDEFTYIFSDDKTCADNVYQVHLLSKNIPEELTNEFKKELLKVVVKYNGRNPDGRPKNSFKALKLHIRKQM